MIGLPWPTVDEDQLREYAGQLRTYASSLAETHGDAHARIGELSASYSSPSYEVLAERWAHFSSGHVSQIVEGCHALASALEVGADVVVAVKGTIIAALVAMAAEFVAHQADAVAAFGPAEAATVANAGGTKEVVHGALDQLRQTAVAERLDVVPAPPE